MVRAEGWDNNGVASIRESSHVYDSAAVSSSTKGSRTREVEEQILDSSTAADSNVGTRGNKSGDLSGIGIGGVGGNENVTGNGTSTDNGWRKATTVASKPPVHVTKQPSSDNDTASGGYNQSILLF